MKTILLPTDFSDIATNAIDYAINLHKNEKVKYILYHAYLIPNSGATMFTSLDTLYYTEAYTRLKREKVRIKEIHVEDVKIITNQNILSSGIQEIIVKHKVSLVVMGTKGASGLDAKIFGSNTVDVIDNIDIPLIVVPNNINFNGLGSVLFCADYEKVNYDKTLSFIKKLALKNKSKLKIIHIKTNPNEEPKIGHINESIEEGKYFQPELNVEFKLVVSSNVEKGIKWYLSKKTEVDLLVMINHKRGFFEKIFKENRTKKFAYSTNIPMLVLQS